MKVFYCTVTKQEINDVSGEMTLEEAKAQFALSDSVVVETVADNQCYKVVNDQIVVQTIEQANLNWNFIRFKRDSLLKDSDFSQLPDSPLTDEKKTEWALYRQQLRDIPEEYSTPAEVVWPVKPS